MKAATTTEIAASASATGPGAVRRACLESIGGLRGKAGLLLAFTSGEQDLEGAAAEIEAAAGGAPCAGMTGKGLFVREGLIDNGCAAIAFGSDVEAAVAVREGASDDLHEAGRAATAEALESLDTEAGIVLLFIDSTRGDIAETVAGAYEAAGPAVPLAGGAAGGSHKAHFHAGRATTDSVVAVAISSERPLGMANTQTCKTRGTPSILTRSKGQLVEEIDGRTAEEVYLEQLGFTGVAFDDDEFEAMAITHPIAQPELHGDYRLRHVLGRTEDGGIILGTGIPESAVIEFTELDFDELLASAASSVHTAIGTLGGPDPQAALIFDCAGRRRALNERITEEVETITAALGRPMPPVVGLYTHGEVARIRGAKGDRNHAVVTVAFG
jgi:hypothetical protein